MKVENYTLRIAWVLLALLWGCEARPGVPEAERVVYEKDSLYNHIVVSENGEARYLRFGYGFVQSAMTLARPAELRVPYTAYLAMGLAFTRPERALMVGLAGGALVRFLQAHRPEVALDVVEIDPGVVQAAGRFFEVTETPACRVHVADGRVFVRRAETGYDWVILDAFCADTMPFHLATVEFFREVKGVLRPGGVVTVNVAPLGSGVLYMSVIRTLAEVFPQVYLFQVPKKGNIVAVATAEENRRSGAEIAAAIRALKAEVGPALDLLEAAGPHTDRNPVVRGAPLLTDDYAPVDWLRYWKGEAHAGVY